MVDSMDEQAEERIRESIDFRQVHTQQDLNKALEKFPGKLRAELRKRFGVSLRADDAMKKDAMRIFGRQLKGNERLDKTVIKGKIAYYVRDAKGRIITSKRTAAGKANFTNEIRRKEIQIADLERQLKKMKARKAELERHNK